MLAASVVLAPGRVELLSVLEYEFIEDLLMEQLFPLQLGQPGGVGGVIPLSLDDIDLGVDDRLRLRGVKQVNLARRQACGQVTGPFPAPAYGHCLVRLRDRSWLGADVIGGSECEAAVGVDESRVI